MHTGHVRAHKSMFAQSNHPMQKTQEGKTKPVYHHSTVTSILCGTMPVKRHSTTRRSTVAPSGKECNQKINKRLGSDTNYGPAVRHCYNEHYIRHKITTTASAFQ